MRTIPKKLNSSILYPLLGHDKNHNEEKYIEKIDIFERKCEKFLLKILNELHIDGSVKTDPKSLPYKNELIIELRGESYMNGPYEFYRVAKQILKKILSEDINKFRFYIHIDIETEGKTLLDSFGKIIYRFRYYKH